MTNSTSTLQVGQRVTVVDVSDEPVYAPIRGLSGTITRVGRAITPGDNGLVTVALERPDGTTETRTLYGRRLALIDQPEASVWPITLFGIHDDSQPIKQIKFLRQASKLVGNPLSLKDAKTLRDEMIRGQRVKVEIDSESMSHIVFAYAEAVGFAVYEWQIPAHTEVTL